jgi:DNA-binding winged helix-turn-helix (wHTH) protein/tetratricopeptide (TPR) repeat protein
MTPRSLGGGASSGGGGGKMDATSDSVSFGPFHLDLLRGELLRGDESVSLAPKPLALLVYLAANRERAVPKHELRKYVWPDVFVSEAALASALKDLRRALGDDGARQSFIRTFRRRGYRFVAKLDAAPVDRSRSALQREPGVRPKVAPFVARGRELRSLTSSAAQAARGRPRVVLISGEAGTGKTRLLEQLIAHPVCSGFALALGRCQADASLPYLPFAEAISARLIDGDESAETVLGDDAALLRPLLQLDSASPRPAEPLGQANALRDRADLFAAVSALFARLSHRHPTLLALEDLHDADSASLDLFAHLVAALADARAGSLPLLVVATLRAPEGGERLEEILPRLEASPVCVEVRLAGLGVGGTRRLIDGLGVARPSHAALLEIQEATNGNPLFIREVIRQTDSMEAIATADTVAASGQRAERQIPRPDSLRAAIAARLARLTPAARDALTAAAFIGERFGLTALGAVTRASEEVTRARLREAERAEVVIGENRTFRFDHPLIREVICEATPERTRRELHRDVAAVLEDLYATSPGEHAMEIARHLVRAADLVAPARLLDYARRAGDQAASVCAWHEAVYFLEAAVAAAERLPVAERATLHLRTGLAANHDYDAETCLRHYARAADAFADAGDDVGLAWSLMYLTRARFTFPSPSQATKLDLRPLEELVVRFGETRPALRASLVGTISEAHWIAGDVELAKATAERAVAIGKLYDDDAACHHAYLGLGLAQLSQLHVREALDSWLESAAHARRLRDPWLQATPGPRITLAFLHLGRLGEARERGRSAVELARRAHNVGELGFACAHLASIEEVSGAFSESEYYTRASLASLDPSGHPWAGVFALCARACAAAQRGAWDEANGALDELLAPRGVPEKPGAAVRFLSAAYRELIAARRSLADLDARRVAGMVSALRSARLDPYVLGAVCALAELCDSLGDAALAATPEAMLRAAFDAGILFTAGWVFLVPRSLARCAALRARWEEADGLFQSAIESSRAAGARVELALSLVDRARMALQRRGVRRDAKRIGRDLDEAIPVLEELALRPALREALTLHHSLRDRE